MNKTEMIIGELLQHDAQYAAHWANESKVWRDAGFYKQLASMVDLQPTHWHADFCSGYSFPLISLYKRAPKESHVQLIALERIRVMINEAAQLARDYGIPTGGHVQSAISVNDDNVASRLYEITTEPERFFGETSAITFIEDDVRTAGVFRSFLKGKKLDSASMLFPGTSGSSTVESPYPYSAFMSAQERGRRVTEQVRAARVGAMALATEFVRPGGSYFVAERVAAARDVSREEITALAIENLQEIAGPLKHGWSRTEISIPDTDVSAAHGSMAWIHNDGQQVRQFHKGLMRGEAKTGVYVAKVTRNDVPFEDLQHA